MTPERSSWNHSESGRTVQALTVPDPSNVDQCWLVDDENQQLIGFGNLLWLRYPVAGLTELAAAPQRNVKFTVFRSYFSIVEPPNSWELEILTY